METGQNPSSLSTENDGEASAPIYEIRVAGCMDEVFWADWFGSLGFSIHVYQDETLLRGPIVDQAALYGLLSRLRDRGLSLISVQKVNPEV